MAQGARAMHFGGLRGTAPGFGGLLAVLLGGAAAAALAATPAHAAENYQLPRNLFGSVGLIDMPSARMAPDGELSAGASFFERNERFHLGFQAFPWLETSFRYSGLSRFDPLYPVYFDRSFAAKVRLLKEGQVVPALAVGADDIIGTGVYGGEYVVASKKFGSIDATLGMGWGRLASNSAFTNPLRIVSKSVLNARPNRFTSDAGGTNFNVLFHGPKVGLFGGLAWDTPIDNLVLTAEYSSDSYAEERASRNFTPRSQFNIGASYHAFDSATLGLNYLYGRAVSASISFQMNPAGDPYPQRIGPQPPAPHIREVEEQQVAISRLAGRPLVTAARRIDSAALVDALWNSAIAVEDVTMNGRSIVLNVSKGDPQTTCQVAARVVGMGYFAIDSVTVRHGKSQAQCRVGAGLLAAAFSSEQEPNAEPLHSLLLASSDPQGLPKTAVAAIAAVRKDLAAQDIQIEAIAIQNADLTLYYANSRYFHEADALDRIVRVLTNDAPAGVERFRLIPTLGGVPQREFTVLRSTLERAYDQTGAYNLVAEATSTGAPMYNPVLAAAVREDYPRYTWGVFPQFRQELFDPTDPFAVQLLGGVAATLEVLPGLSLQGEAEVSFYDNFNVLRPPSSDLPHVRSDFLKYFSQGKNGIGNLEADYRFRLGPNIFATVRAGYLESMFAGAGGEILWRPENQRWAVGADLFAVKQRAYDRLFGFNPYQAYTGHVSLYYASPWYNLNFALGVGRYLAGDRGFTFEATRRFDSGVEIGAFFTRTNIPASVFGEGSFDKGIMIRIPLGWMAPVNTQTQFNLDLRPVQRDGGQRLGGDTTLYEETRRASTVEMQGLDEIAPASAQ